MSNIESMVQYQQAHSKNIEKQLQFTKHKLKHFALILLNNVGRKLVTRDVGAAFHCWSRNAKQMTEKRDKMHHALLRLYHQQLSVSWTKWIRVHFLQGHQTQIVVMQREAKLAIILKKFQDRFTHRAFSLWCSLVSDAKQKDLQNQVNMLKYQNVYKHLSSLFRSYGKARKKSVFNKLNDFAQFKVRQSLKVMMLSMNKEYKMKQDAFVTWREKAKLIGQKMEARKEREQFILTMAFYKWQILTFVRKVQQKTNNEKERLTYRQLKAQEILLRTLNCWSLDSDDNILPEVIQKWHSYVHKQRELEKAQFAVLSQQKEFEKLLPRPGGNISAIGGNSSNNMLLSNLSGGGSGGGTQSRTTITQTNQGQTTTQQQQTRSFANIASKVSTTSSVSKQLTSTITRTRVPAGIPQRLENPKLTLPLNSNQTERKSFRPNQSSDTYDV